MEWSKEQQSVIDIFHREVLVSAAAGSGKTAVLVEHIIDKVTRKENPLDIDRLLVVTFTKAAAGEMKERIYRAINKKAQEHPENLHLQKQLTYIHNAHITTIDSFCNEVVRNYFDVIDLDPSVRVAESGELTLIEEEVMADLFEEEYKDSRDDFIDFVEAFVSKNSEDKLEDYIKKIHHYIQVFPLPDQWLDQALLDYRDHGPLTPKNYRFMKFLNNLADAYLLDCKEMCQDLISFCRNSTLSTCSQYEEAIVEDLNFVNALLETSDYENRYKMLSNYKQTTTCRVKKGIDVEEKSYYKNKKEQIKNLIDKELSKGLYVQSEEEVKKYLPIGGKYLEELILLVKKYSKNLKLAKEEKKVADFSDIERYTLEILTDQVDGKLQPSLVAKELSEQFDEILIDEYQDSNQLQEEILRSISKVDTDQPNVFMVGDVKQSIYRFRLARPELFMEKFKNYPRYNRDDKDLQVTIVLDKNFRSRKEVLDTCNALFYRIMDQSIGNVTYTEEHALHAQADYPPIPEGQSNKTELLLLTIKEEEDFEIRAKMLAQGRLIAEKIKDMVNKKFQVMDKESKCNRDVTYGDFAILLRTASGKNEYFTEAFEEAGVPLSAENKKGYFSTLEVTTILNYLNILDNPLQDLELTSVLKSPIGGFSDVDLATLKINTRENSFYYNRLCQYLEDGEEKDLQEKCGKFLKLYSKHREAVKHYSIYQLLSMIYRETGYLEQVRAMPGGERREANLFVLKEKAATYEETSFHGLFQFTRYIKRIQSYNVDYGEAALGENHNAVSLLTIHKSKGLEYPVVFVADLDKSFNKMDQNDTLVMDADYGIGIEARDGKKRTKSGTLVKKIISQKIALDSIGEELRVLYVAMTRAREKLFLVGMKKEKKVEEIMEDYEDTMLSFQERKGAGSFLQWILRANLPNSLIETTSIDCSEYVLGMLVKGEDREFQMRKLLQFKENVPVDEAFSEKLKEVIDYTYPYESSLSIARKYSVSEIKHAAIEKLEEGEASFERLFHEKQTKDYLPAFMKEEERVTESIATMRGTAIHRVFELIDYRENVPCKNPAELLSLIVGRSEITPLAASYISPDIIEKFLESDLALEMKKAQEEGRLYREHPFVMQVPASRAKEGASEDEMVLVQGEIDVFYENEEGIVLVDYKTDYVKTEDALVNRYRKQLQLYAEAIEKMTGKKVVRILIYSTNFGKTIEL